MRSRLLAVCVVGLASLVAGCSAEIPVGSSRIEDVWEKIGCKKNDPMGTRGIIDLSIDPPEPPIEHNGSCTPYEDGKLAFFWQLSDAEAVIDWLDSGDLEVGATDAVFVDGAVVILATDAETAQKFSEIFTAHGG